jgi:hypothetical protein
MPTGTYSVEIWHNYKDKGFYSSGGDASIWELKVVNPNPPSPKPSPSPSPVPTPTPSPQPTVIATPAPSQAPENGDTSENSEEQPAVNKEVEKAQPAPQNFFEKVASTVRQWWGKLFGKK